eukprot:10006501-Heterocapsa_arctica.AAC.1
MVHGDHGARCGGCAGDPSEMRSREGAGLESLLHAGGARKRTSRGPRGCRRYMAAPRDPCSYKRPPKAATLEGTLAVGGMPVRSGLVLWGSLGLRVMN